MLSWIVDNANVVYVILGVVGLGVAVSWWLNRRVRELGVLLGVIALVVLVWLLTLFVPTDRKQIRDNLWAMAGAVMNQKPDDLVKHWAKDFRFQNLGREELAEAAAKVQITGVNLWEFDVKNLTKDKAEIWFRCTAEGKGGQAFFAICRAHFIKEGDHWKLQRIAFYQPVANTDQEIPIPLGR
jgi:hypothetical protein